MGRPGIGGSQLAWRGLEALPVRERRKPRLPDEIGPNPQQRIIASSLAQPEFGARNTSADSAREKSGGIRPPEPGFAVLCGVRAEPPSRCLPVTARHR